MSDLLRTVSPVDGRIAAELPFEAEREIASALEAARKAQGDWRATQVGDRQAVLTRAVDAFVTESVAIAEELTWQMGRPAGQAPGEVRGFEERARHMIAIAPEALADIDPGARDGFTRFVRREPLGVVFVLAPWNYPYLTAVNAIVPALLAGNAVVLKPSHQTPLTGERMTAAFAAAGLPAGLFQVLHLTHDASERIMASDAVDFVAFTGSVDGGHAVQRALSGRFVAAGLELGGKDPAYVRPDADLTAAVEGLVDGAFFNSGQSCCGIERIYVHDAVYGDFVDAYAALTRKYVLGNPFDAETTLGPMARATLADTVRAQTAAAIASGAKALVDTSGLAADTGEGPYLAPQVLIDVTHDMAVMREESFGPVVGIMRVSSDDEAIALMNDSDLGLTASVWTRDEAKALAIGDRVETGTWFMNRCDYLDPALAWTGVKNSGRGCTLSRVGFEHLTRPKSFHLRHA